MPYYLTPKQERALEYSKQAIKQTGRAPSLREAAADLGMSEGVVRVTAHRMRTRLGELIRERYGLRPAVLMLSILVLVNLANTVAEFAGVAAALCFQVLSSRHY